MQIKNKSKIFILVYALVLTFTPAFAFAQTPTTTTSTGSPEASIKQFLCAPDPANRGDDFYNCVNKLYRFGLAAGLTAAVLFTVIAGYMYMAGGEGGAKQAKSMISTTLVGIFLLLTTFILLRQINPDLVTFKSIRPQTIDKITPGQINSNIVPTLQNGGGPAGGTSGGVAVGNDHPENSCATSASNCTNLASLGISCKTSSSCTAQNALAQKLVGMANVLTPQNKFFQVNEAWPQTIHHDDGCHLTGACVDIGLSGGGLTWDQLCLVAKQQGLGVWNETKQESANCGTDHSTTNTTGPHLHVYLIN